jgi:DNA-binding NarL/FixJ family response regulator
MGPSELAAAESRAADKLIEREPEVLRLVTPGLSNTEPAARLHLSEATVKTHVSRVSMKQVYAYEPGLATPSAE